MKGGNDTATEATEVEDAEWQYLLEHIEEDANNNITVKAEEPAIIQKTDTTEWAERYRTADSINNYCRKHTNANDDPEQAALQICGKIRETLTKKDHQHCDPEHVSNIFMGCNRYHDLYPDEWDAETATRILLRVFGPRSAREVAEERADQSNQLADAVARDQEKREKEREAKRGGKPLILKTCGALADEASRRRIDYIGTDAKNTTTYFIEDKHRQTWYDITKAARIKESKGYVWFDGIEWHVDDFGRELSGAITKNAESVAKKLHIPWFKAGGGSGPNAAFEDIRKMLMKVSPDDITGLRPEPTISTAEVYEHGLTCTDGVIIIDAAGIHIAAHDPNREVWFGSVPVSTTDLLPNLTSMTFDEVVNHFPHARESLEACGADKVGLMASMAGSTVYYMMPGHTPLDVWFYLWDGHSGGTGKSTHMRRFQGFFGKYAAYGVGWDVFTGENNQNGDFYGKICVECEEAGIADIRSVEKLKSYTSGGWSLKRMYQNPVGIEQSLIMISLANHPPMLSPLANARPIQERLQPCEFTQKLRNTGTEFPCSDEEYYKFLFNVGCWVAYQLMKAGGKVCKKDLPYYVSPEEVAKATTRVPWKETLMDIGEWSAGNDEPLKEVLASLRYELRERGWVSDDFAGAPELKNLEKFRAALDGLGIPKRDEYQHVIKGRYDTLKIVRKNGDAGKESKWWLKNFALNKRAPKGEEQELLIPASSQRPDYGGETPTQ